MSQVNYVGKAANLYEEAGYKLSGASYVVNKYLGTTWLWDRVRVVGAAYGGFSHFDSHTRGRPATPPSSCCPLRLLSTCLRALTAAFANCVYERCCQWKSSGTGQKVVPEGAAA